MTLRAKPVSSRSGRPDRTGGDRRTFLVNLGFTLAIALSLLILVGYAAWSWWDDHNGTVATVNGVTLTKDDLRARLRVEQFRITYTEARIQTLLTAGRLSQAQADQQLQQLQQRSQQISVIAVGRLVDAELQSQLAKTENITVTDADVAAQFLKEKTIPEERHIWVIEVAPADDPDTGEPGDTEKAAARDKADTALADLKAGKSWDEVAKAVSTADSAPQAGDLGWAEKEIPLDQGYLDAVFSVAANTPTDVIEGKDGIFRIGRATEIDPERVDETYDTRIQEADMSVADYEVAVRSDVVRQKLNDMVVADLSKPGLQRHVEQIYLPVESTVPPADAVKVRHILFAPKDDPSGAQTLAKTDPAWRAAEDEARAAYEALKKDPSKFDEMARTLSDEGSAKTTGGKQPFYETNSLIDQAFAKAIFEPGLTPGRLLVPVESGFGWHVIQFLRTYGAGDESWLKSVRQQALDGAKFEELARDQGEGEEAAKGGDVGWIAKGTEGELKEVPIFDADIGGVTDVVTIPDDGSYLWKVVAEEMRTPTDDQIEIFKANGFDNWYSGKYAEAKIDIAGAASGVGG